jgi:hypothetical protein
MSAADAEREHVQTDRSERTCKRTSIMSLTRVLAMLMAMLDGDTENGRCDVCEASRAI